MGPVRPVRRSRARRGDHQQLVAVADRVDRPQPARQPAQPHLRRRPGSTIEDSVTLANFSNVPLTFRLYGTDAFNNADGRVRRPRGRRDPRRRGLVGDDLPGVHHPRGRAPRSTSPSPSPSPPTPPRATTSVPCSRRRRPRGPDPTARRSPSTGAPAPASTCASPGRSPPSSPSRTSRPPTPRRSTPSRAVPRCPTGSATSATSGCQGTATVTVGGPFGLLSTTAPADEIPEILPGAELRDHPHRRGRAGHRRAGHGGEARSPLRSVAGRAREVCRVERPGSLPRLARSPSWPSCSWSSGWSGTPVGPTSAVNGPSSPPPPCNPRRRGCRSGQAS